MCVIIYGKCKLKRSIIIKSIKIYKKAPNKKASLLSVFFDDSTEDHSLWPYKIANDASPIDILAQ